LLKELLASAPVLKIVDPNEIFVVSTHACKEGLGGFLTQNGYVIGYEYKILRNMRGTMPHMNWNLLPLFMH
jgi:hypothetical protein